MRKPRFFSPLGFDVQTYSDHKTPKIKLCSVIALKRYRNQKNLIHGREMATISKFGPQIFETYFKVFVSLYYARFLLSFSPFPVVIVEGPRLLLRRLIQVNT